MIVSVLASVVLSLVSQLSHAITREQPVMIFRYADVLCALPHRRNLYVLITSMGQAFNNLRL